MAGSRKQSNAQTDEGQHRNAMTSDQTDVARPDEGTAFDAEAELASIKADVADMTASGPAKDEPAPDQEMIKVKTTGPFMLHDPTTGYSVTEEGDEVIKTSFIESQLELGRIVKA